MSDRHTGTDWERLRNMSEEEIYSNAMSDPDCPPDAPGQLISLRKEDGATLLERFHKALDRGKKKISLTVRYDADIVCWYKAKGKGYQSAMNAALRSVMEAEKETRHTSS